MKLTTSWKGRSQPERVDAYTRWSLYGLSAMEPVLLLFVAVGSPPRHDAVVPVLLVVALVHTVACLRVLSAGVAHFLGGPLPARKDVLVLAGLTLVASVVAVWGYPAVASDGFLGNVRSAVLLAVWGLTAMALTPLLPGPRLILAAAVVASLVSVENWVATGRPDRSIAMAITLSLIVVGLLASYRVSIWLLGVVWEQDRSRVVHARLAVAEERLRFSRDLHDVFGRTLSVVAVKSELAAELARRGQPGAPEQMLEVRQIAQDSLREVRAVVAGYRAADLQAELAGARAVLRSAGIACEVQTPTRDSSTQDTELPENVQQALAWVVREAVTNVVRHTQATRCTIALDVGGGGPDDLVTLTIENDGVKPTASAERTPGAGLRGLSERLVQVGGTLETEHDEAGGRFMLRGQVPMRAGTPAAGDAGAREVSR